MHDVAEKEDRGSQHSDIDKFTQQLERLEKTAKALLETPSTSKESNTNTNANVVRVHAGEMGVWLVVVILAIVGGFAYSSLHSDLTRAQDYLNNIYQVAPHCVHDDQEGKLKCPAL
jgi:hypothetical protein